MSRALPRWFVYAIVLVVVIAMGRCSPWFMSEHEVEISGEFRADGSCTVITDGMPLYSTARNARTHYSAGHDTNDGDPTNVFTERDVECRPLGTGEFGPDDLQIIFLDHGTARLGQYAVVSEWPSQKEMTALVVYSDAKHGYGTPGAGFSAYPYGDIDLEVTRGSIDFTRIDSALVTGAFRVKAVRRWRSGLTLRQQDSIVVALAPP